MDAVDSGYIYHKTKNVRQQVNTENKKTAAARPQGCGFFAQEAQILAKRDRMSRNTNFLSF